jgi:ABC-type glycerol-3-phosphate transport system permease component
MKSNRRSARLLVVVILVLLSCVYLLPIYMMVITSVKSLEEINQGNYLLPTSNRSGATSAKCCSAAIASAAR